MTVWQDTKVVSALATNSQPLATTQVERKQKNGEKKIVNCPQLIANYNQKMGGVDHNDQLGSTTASMQEDIRLICTSFTL